MTFGHLNSVPCKDFQGGGSQGNLSEVTCSILIRGTIHGNSMAAMDGPAGPVMAAEHLWRDSYRYAAGVTIFDYLFWTHFYTYLMSKQDQ